MADVLVVGAGPAGSIAARTCAKAGLRVVLVEARSFPREKICGDALIADSQALLTEEGLFDAVRAIAHPCSAIRVVAPGGREVRLAAPVFTVRRERLDTLLRDAALEAGATPEEGKVVGPRRDAEGAVAGARLEGGREIEARLTILATGAAGGPLADFGVQTRSWPSALAMRNYVKAPSFAPDALIIDFERALVPGYGWIFPMGNGEANVGVCVFRDQGAEKHNLQELYDRFVTTCPAAQAALAGSTPLDPPKGAPLRCGLVGARSHVAGLLVTGEALGSTYSLSGEGIGKAMETARIAGRVAVQVLGTGRTDEASLATYDAALEAAGIPAKFEQYRQAERFMRRPAVVDLVAWSVRRSRTLQTALERVVREEVPPTAVTSVRGLLRALVG